MPIDGDGPQVDPNIEAEPSPTAHTAPSIDETLVPQVPEIVMHPPPEDEDVQLPLTQTPVQRDTTRSHLAVPDHLYTSGAREQYLRDRWFAACTPDDIRFDASQGPPQEVFGPPAADDDEKTRRDYLHQLVVQDFDARAG